MNYGSGFGNSTNDKMRRKAGIMVNGSSSRPSRGGGKGGPKPASRKKTSKKGGYR